MRMLIRSACVILLPYPLTPPPKKTQLPVPVIKEMFQLTTLREKMTRGGPTLVNFSTARSFWIVRVPWRIKACKTLVTGEGWALVKDEGIQWLDCSHWSPSSLASLPILTWYAHHSPGITSPHPSPLLFIQKCGRIISDWYLAPCLSWNKTKRRKGGQDRLCDCLGGRVAHLYSPSGGVPWMEEWKAVPRLLFQVCG